MNKLLFTLLLLALVAYGQTQERVAIIQTLDNNDSIGFQDLSYLTDKLRETAVNVLPKKQFGVMTTESIIAFLGSQEKAVKACNESSCLAELGRKVSADYVAQGRIGRFNNNLTIKVELYSVRSGNLIGSFTGDSKDIVGLRDIINEKAANLFREMLAESSSSIVVDDEVPAVVEPYVPKPKVEKPIKTSFWVAIALDVLGAAIIYTGYEKNKEMQEAYDRYKEIGKNGYYKDAWENAEDLRSIRDTRYAIGSIFLVSGIGVHIWF